MAWNLLHIAEDVCLGDRGIIEMKALKKENGERPLEQGFSLLEAAIVLVIIAVMAIVSIPAIVNTLTHQKLLSASDAFVNQAKFARVQAAARNRAYEFHVDLSDGINSGAIILNEGIGAACTPASFSAGNGATLDIRNRDYGGTHPNVRIESVVPQNLAATSLCFKPDGRVYRTDTRAPVDPVNTAYAAGEAVYTIRLYTSEGLATDHSREIIIPYNGLPRVVLELDPQ